MLNPVIVAGGLGTVAPSQLREAINQFLPANATAAEKIATIEVGLQSPLGQSLREAMAKWIVDEIVPVNALVPEAYLKWRPPVRDAMMFVVTRLSPARLAPKLLEQLDLPPSTPAEKRLLCLIAKVPGLQKLGQVIARNQHLRPALRKALTKLENGIRDVNPDDVCRIVQQELGDKVSKYSVQIASSILSEASVSAVIRFTWINPVAGRRERGVFKVLKPHIPEYFAEDMDYLQGLAQHFGDCHHTYGFPAHLIPDTFQKVRRLLRHEVNFSREQKTLLEAWPLYEELPGVKVPRLIRPLCTSKVTALSEESGIKITSAAARLSQVDRRRVAEQLLEALVAVPLLSSVDEAVFHGDPHAGNLLYDNRKSQLTIIDWALRERLGREQRRHLALLFLMISLRDAAAVSSEIAALAERPIRVGSAKEQLVRACVDKFLGEAPAKGRSSAADAMRLLERAAIQGIKFPTSLIMLSKVMFTLEGMLVDIAGPDTGMGFALARHVAQHWLANRSAYRSPLKTLDWLTLQCSALLYTGRLWIQWEQAMLNRYLPPGKTA